MKLQTKLAIVVIAGLIASLLNAYFMISLFGNVFTPGYDYRDMNDISGQISLAIEKSPSQLEEDIRQLLAEFAERYQGIEIEWVREDGTLLYSSSGRAASYSFAEMMDHFVENTNQIIHGETATMSYKVTSGSEPAYLIMTLQKDAAKSFQIFVFLFFSDTLTFLLYSVPFILILAIPVLFSIMYSTYVNRRIRRLFNAMQSMDLDDAKCMLVDRSRDEIGQLVRHFNQMSQKIREQFMHIKQVEEQRQQLVCNLSHDLRTPLTLITGYAENLVVHGSRQDNTVNQRWYSIILEKSRYMEQLLTQLFEVSLMNRRQTAVSAEPCNMTELLSRILLDYALVLQEKGIEPDLRIPEQNVILWLDTFQIERAVRNLIDNALQYGAEGRYLGVCMLAGKETVTLSISDRGKGIPADERSRIFEPFFRLEKERSSGGLGMGLTIVSQIVSAHNGTLSVQSEPLKGTIFTIALPITEVQPAFVSDGRRPSV